MSTSGLRRRLTATCAAGLRPLEENIGLGLRGRLPFLACSAGQSSSSGELAAPRIAIVGRPSLEFTAALRATWCVGGAAAPIDIRLRNDEDLAERLAEAQVELAIVAGVGDAEEKLAFSAARSLGAPAVSVASLHAEGSQSAVDSVVADSNNAVINSSANRANMPLLLFSDHPDSIGPKAAQVSNSAFEVRTSAAVKNWKLTQADTVLPIGMRADLPCAIVDALEAPLVAGSKLVIPAGEPDVPPFKQKSGTNIQVASDMWASVYEASEATVVVISVETLRSFVTGYDELSLAVRSELQRRFSSTAPRLCVAVCKAGTTPSQDLAESWKNIFNCPLTWHFSCAEAGSLFSVGGSLNSFDTGVCAKGLEWRAESKQEELSVRGDAVFDGYQGRPRSTSDAFDENGFFRWTGHRISKVSASIVKPEPKISDFQVDAQSSSILSKEPNVPHGRQMKPRWTSKKVPMKTYDQWRTGWGALLLTKKHNTAHKVYKGRFK